MKPKKVKTHFLTVRVSPAVYKAFRAKIGVTTPSAVLREVIESIVNERLILTPPVTIQGNPDVK